MKPLEGKVALVTGASRGIGAAIATVLARDGAHVFVNYNRGADAAQAVVDQILAAGGQAAAIQADVSDFAAAEAMIAATKDAGYPDILVNNAGITVDKLFLRMSEDDWKAVIDTNLGGTFNVTRAALRWMLKKTGASIVNIGSVSGITGLAGQVNYSAAKAGLTGFTKAIAREVASRGITANVVAPGPVDTDMLKAMPEKAKEQLQALVPLGRAADPMEIAEVVAFLAGPKARYITGQVLAVDGGMTM